MADSAVQLEERTRLLAERDALRTRLQAIRDDYRQGLDADSEERAVQLENREVLDAIARATSAELERVERRLAELDG
jgi:hypothetical protein